ncbi:hypothetical protein DNTS_029245 [Danionella cerebrum]|uniref:Protein amnionless n=1 Tax=Danionella cerebrum TaxID=2873325 RepID=A0A553QTL6_9TELE|nr:hypothetical protein DNTS_029245 [Danionella translucida]
MALGHGVLLLLLYFSLFTDALYKQWIPDTNFENSTNWDKGSIPCGSDQVAFAAGRRVSVYVEESHWIAGMSLPVDGELILALSGSGFALTETEDPDCGSGVIAQFKDSESLKWFDPSLWVAASTSDDLHRGRYQFSVHEESVPCQFDDVEFREASSFRVDISSDRDVSVKTVSVLGNKFTQNSDFGQYLASKSGKLQFHGSASLNVGASGCADITGCICDNSRNRDKICANVKCESLACKYPLHPVGHCCGVCGAIVNLQFSSAFNFESYRQRLLHLFLSQHKYASVHMAMSKVSKQQKLLEWVFFRSSQEIQVLLLDGKSGNLADSLTQDIVKDIHSHGSNIGIEQAEFQTSSGASSNHRQGSEPGVVVGAVVGVLVIVAFLSVLVLLSRRRVLKMPFLPSLRSMKNSGDIGELGGPLDHGFDNPMFDKPTMMPEEPELYAADKIKAVTLTPSGVHFVNPVYDEFDFNA